MSGSAVDLVYVLDIPLAAAWRQECGGESGSRGAPWDGEELCLSVLAVPACRKCPSSPGRDYGGKNRRPSRASGGSPMSPHTYDLGGHTVRGGTGNRSPPLGGRERGSCTLGSYCLSWDIAALPRLPCFRLHYYSNGVLPA